MRSSPSALTLGCHPERMVRYLDFLLIYVWLRWLYDGPYALLGWCEVKTSLSDTRRVSATGAEKTDVRRY